MYIPNGVGISDLLKAIKLAKEICDKCFRADQGADVKYLQFLRDVNILGTALARFQLTFERYEKQYPSTERPKAAPAIENSDSIWIQCVGDFYQTLQECDSLLSRYGYLRNGRSHAVFNLHWWQSVEPTVDRLMAKLRLHIDKVDFYAKPHEFNAVIRNGSEIQQLRRQVANLERFLISGPEQSQALWTDCIPEELKVKLEEHFQTNTPSWSPRGSEWPLKEAFEALTFHFAASTVTFNPEPGSDTIPNVSHFLGLAKSIWILEKIKQSPQFRNVGSGSIWADRMRGFEDDLRGQMHRFEAGELAKPSTQQLLSLPTSFYTIGGGDTNDTDPLNAGQAGPSEEKILEIQIESDSDDRESALLVFRENETDFRFVVSTKTVGSLLAQYDKEITVSMDINRFIPVYANPFRGGSPQYNVLLLNQRGKKPKEFQLLCHEDLAKLQRALLGYRVHHEMPVARWCINGSQAPGDSGQGILQLWQYKPLPAMSTTDMSGASDGSSSDKALRSLTSTSAAQKSPTSPNVGGTIDFVGWSGFPHAPLSRKSDLCESPISPSDRTDVQLSRQTSNTAKRESLRMLSKELRYSRTSSVTASSSNGYRPCRNSSTMSSVPSTTRSSVVSAIRGPRGDGVAFSKPELPALVILTWCEGRYSFLHLTLDATIKIEPGLCGCRIPARHCNRIILKSKKHFAIRMLSADIEGNEGLESWDLSVFRHPRPDKLKKAKLNERVSSLELQFTDEEEKIEFLEELTSLENIRTANQNDYEQSLRDARRRAKS